MVVETAKSGYDPPQQKGTIVRTHLLSKLRSGLNQQLTLITAPPGYGKTTLAAQLAQRVTDYTVVWQRLHESDRDLRTLHYDTMHAFHTRLGKDAPSYPPSATSAELAAHLADVLRTSHNQRLLYVLDDVHLLNRANATQEWLYRLVELLPRNVHLMLLSREVPELPYANLIAKNNIAAVEVKDLRFTFSEAVELNKSVFNGRASKADIREMVDLLEGWPAGIAIALQPLSDRLEQTLIGGKGPEALFSALAGNMLNAQPPGIRRFLLESATLFQMTPESIQGILDMPSALHWLDEAYQRNLFISQVRGGYEYHSLFRSVLQRKLREQHEERFVELHCRAAEWFNEQGNIEWALEHYLVAGQTEKATVLAERLAPSYDAQDRVETLFEWNKQLRSAGAHSPTLSYVCARGYADRYEFAAARSELDRAEQAFRAQGDQVGVYNVIIRRAATDLIQGQEAAAADTLRSILPELPDKANLIGRARGMLGRALLHMGQTDEAAALLAEALPMYRADGDSAGLSYILQDLTIVTMQRGQFEKSSAYLQEQVALKRKMGSLSALSVALNHLGYFYHQTGKYQQAYDSFQEGLGYVARISDRRSESYLRWSLADLLRDTNHFTQAEQQYERALQIAANDEPALQLAIMINISTLYRWWGRATLALEYAHQAVKKAATVDAETERMAARVALIAARQMQTPDLEEWDALNTIMEDMSARGDLSQQLNVLALMAWYAYQAGAEERGQQALLDGCKLAQQTRMWQALATEISFSPEMNKTVRGQADNLAPLMQAVDDLKRTSLKLAARAPHIGSPESKRTYQLQVHTLGTERVIRDGVELSTSDWRAVTARELFLYLVFNAPSTREEISLKFWPDLEPQRVRSNFHTTLYRARQAVGEQVIVFEDEHYQLADEVEIWCDAFQMEDYCDKARLLPFRDARAEDLWQQAVDLYQGELLPEVYTSWADQRRQHYDELYLEALLSVSECARVRGDFQQALRTLGHALEVDPLREDIHRALMITYSKMGERSLVARQYKTLRSRLQREMGLLPSQQTEDLARILLQ